MYNPIAAVPDATGFSSAPSVTPRTRLDVVQEEYDRRFETLWETIHRQGAQIEELRKTLYID